MKRKELKVSPGGLYRCCIQTAFAWMAEAPNEEAKEGETFPCRYEPDAAEPAKLVVHGGELGWYDPDYPPFKKQRRDADDSVNDRA